ncbi:MAG: amidase family protein, partial [Oryzihumus sp.]
SAAWWFGVGAVRPAGGGVPPGAGCGGGGVPPRPPLPGIPVGADQRRAAGRAGELLRQAGHPVRDADPAYRPGSMNEMTARWFAGAAQEAEGLDPQLLQHRTRGHIRLGRLLQQRGLVKDGARERWRAAVEPFFERYDVLVTPALAGPPPPAARWHERSWLANVMASTRYAPFQGPWNLAGYPAMTVPIGGHNRRMPLAVQLVAPAGRESRLIGVAAQLEALAPWQRVAPGFA